MINDQEVRRVAKLARLKLSEEEVVAFAEKLSAILGYFDDLKAVPTDGVEPLVTPTDMGAHLRADETMPTLSVEDGLMNAPSRTGNLFKVPPVV
jgi:aspartyl-tRNA(Asn)/glutamyl-tRNA(Gln) amidotransferase subunit C